MDKHLSDPWFSPQFRQAQLEHMARSWSRTHNSVSKAEAGGLVHRSRLFLQCVIDHPAQRVLGQSTNVMKVLRFICDVHVGTEGPVGAMGL